MADKSQDQLIESLMALAISAAPLIKRARDSGIFNAGSRADDASQTIVEATVVTPPPPPPEAPPAPTAPADFSAEKAALQDIIVSQAMKIAALEAEVARLAAAAKPKPGKA